MKGCFVLNFVDWWRFIWPISFYFIFACRLFNKYKVFFIRGKWFLPCNITEVFFVRISIFNVHLVFNLLGPFVCRLGYKKLNIQKIYTPCCLTDSRQKKNKSNESLQFVHPFFLFFLFFSSTFYNKNLLLISISFSNTWRNRSCLSLLLINICRVLLLIYLSLA